MTISRRTILRLLGSAVLLLSSKARAWFAQAPAAAADFSVVHLFETTMAAPDIICFEIRDQAIVKGRIYQIPPQPSNSANWTIVGGVIGHIISPTKNWFRSADRFPTKYLDRTIIDNPANWPSIGGQSVLGVYRKSYPYDQGVTSYRGNQCGLTSMRHYVYCQLSGNLPQGTHTINFPRGSSLPPSSFIFNDKTTRCHALRATQVGHRPGDDKKLAYLAVWIPRYGSDGAVDFAKKYGFTTFYIIDANGTNVFSGRIIQRVTPTTVEKGEANQYLGETGLGVRTVSAVTYSPACQITTDAPHGFSGGERIQFRGMGADASGAAMNLNYYIGLVGTIVDSTNFILLDFHNKPVNSSNFRRWRPKIYASGYDSQIVVMTLKNRAGTYVFGLDYSALTAVDLVGKTAPYRVQVPGLGCSYPFDIDDGVWYRAAKIGCAGYYHQTQGMALDGRYGYSRPAAFIDGQNGVAIYWSTMTAAFTSECQYGVPFKNDMGFGAFGPWITSNRAAGIYGGFRDAGDWSILLASHALATYQMLNTYEIMGLLGAGQKTDFNFPRMSQVLDPTLYAGTDGLPDLVHAAMWEIDFWRRTQQLWNAIPGLPREYHGGVSGAVGYGNVAPGDGGNPYEPSWLSTYPAFLCAPDHAANYYAAFLFAKAATVFRDAGFSTLASMYTTAALDAWKFSENMFGNLAAEDAYYNGYLSFSKNWPSAEQAGSITVTAANTTLVGSRTRFTSVLADGDRFAIKYIPGVFTVASGGVVDDTHVVVTAAPTVSTPVTNPGIHWVKLGQDATAFKDEMTSLDTTAKVSEGNRGRFCAAGALYRLTSDPAYKMIVEKMYVSTYVNALDYGVWEYMHGPNPSAALVREFSVGKRLGLANICTSVEDSANAYYAASRTGLGQGLLSLFYGYILTDDPSVRPRARKMWQAMAHWFHGANQYGYCVVNGLGNRNIEWGVLCQDRIAQGIQQPAGSVAYSWWPAVGGPGGFLNFASGDPPINFTLDFPNNPVTTPYPGFNGLGRALQPNRFDIPVWEFITENSFVIFQMEFTAEQTVIPYWSLMCILSSLDGNPKH